MNRNNFTTLLGAFTMIPLIAVAQSDDMAAERARLANQRIQVEAERRADEEPQGDSAAAEPSAVESGNAAPTGDSPVRESAPPAPADSPVPDAPTPIPASAPPGDGVSVALEQLRELGELRDAGYLTQEEFDRIKSRILDSRF